MTALALLLALVVGGWVVTRAIADGIRRTNESHSLAGRFGSSERERVVRRRAEALQDAADLLARLGEFAQLLRAHARKGTPVAVSVSRDDGSWHDWAFGDAEVWRVRQTSVAGRATRQLVVSDAVATEHGVVVSAYDRQPGHLPVTLDVVDVRPDRRRR